MQTYFDEAHLLACMAYVDLNPIRAGLGETLEASDFTSIQTRIQAYAKTRDDRSQSEQASAAPPPPAPWAATETGVAQDEGISGVPAAPLMAFAGTALDTGSGLPFHFADYLELVDWTGRAIRADKRGFIPADVPPILRRLGVETDRWIETVRHFQRHFFDFVGPAEVLEQCSQAMGRRWLRGVGACRRLLGGEVCTHLAG